jgi:hypothetical protein
MKAAFETIKRSSMKAIPLTVFFLLLIAAFPLVAGPLAIPDVDDIYPKVPDWRQARILHIGDSHLSFGFKSEMARCFKEAGSRFRQKPWKGSRTKSWIVSGVAKQLIEEYRPTVVVVTLGTNEMRDGAPVRQMPWIRALIERIGLRTCYWLGPPPLLEDTYGYNDYMKDHVAPCRYFDARALGLKKRDDGTYHLSRAEGEMWAGLVWQWMNGR